MDLKNFKEKMTKQIMEDITRQVHEELNITKNGSKKSSVKTKPTEIEDGGNMHHFLHHVQKSVTHAAKKNHVGRKLTNTVNNHVVPVVKDYAKTALKEGAMALAETNPELMPLVPIANYGIDKAIGSGIKKPRKKREQSQKEKNRHELVRKLMKEHGMSLPEASKHIKQNNINY